MTDSSILDPDAVPEEAKARGFKGHDLRSLGPSDSSDSGSDLLGSAGDSEEGKLTARDAGARVGDLNLDDSSDRFGTGEHLAAGSEPDIRLGGDIAADRIVSAEEAGLGGGLDQAEEAQLGITDEELAAKVARDQE